MKCFSSTRFLEHGCGVYVCVPRLKCTTRRIRIENPTLSLLFPLAAATHYRGKRARCCNAVVIVVSIVIVVAAFVPGTLVAECVIVGTEHEQSRRVVFSRARTGPRGQSHGSLTHTVRRNSLPTTKEQSSDDCRVHRSRPSGRRCRTSLVARLRLAERSSIDSYYTLQLARDRAFRSIREARLIVLAGARST